MRCATHASTSSRRVMQSCVFLTTQRALHTRQSSESSSSSSNKSSCSGHAKATTAAAAATMSSSSTRQQDSEAQQRIALLEKELHDTRRELTQTRLRLAQATRTAHGRTVDADALLRRLDAADKAALQAATELRYTAFALQCSHDSLAVELRRLLAIGLTADDVDAAAMEAGARNYIRANIGYRVEHVHDEPAVAIDLDKASRDSAVTTGDGEAAATLPPRHDDMLKAAPLPRLQRPKLTVSAVRGCITTYSEDGERIGQWGGTECFLSRQRGLGPCLVVRSSKHKRHEGTFFRLAQLRRVLSLHVLQGKLTVIIAHAMRVCTVVIETASDVNELRMMAGLLQDRSQWTSAAMERDVASRRRVGGGGGRAAGGEAAAAAAMATSQYRSGRLRDPALAALENDDMDDDSDSNNDEEASRDTRAAYNNNSASSPTAAV